MDCVLKAACSVVPVFWCLTLLVFRPGSAREGIIRLGDVLSVQGVPVSGESYFEFCGVTVSTVLVTSVFCALVHA